MTAQETALKIDQIVKDIEDIKIQGATAVAESSFEGIKLFLESYDPNEPSFDKYMADVEKVGLRLVNARPNEPLARNGFKYVFNGFRTKYPNVHTVAEAKTIMLQLMSESMNILQVAKDKIVKLAVDNFFGYKGILTHCHSSTVEAICKGIAAKRGEEGFSVVATETRPVYQGRITATNLFKAGLDVKLIVDNAVTSFLVGDQHVPIDAVFIGCDEITVRGDTLNKVGSYSVALSAYYANKPLYVVGTILKLDPSTIYDDPEIEMRDSKEVWPEAPAGLKIINPAFELIPHDFITGFVTEQGILKPEQLETELSKAYGQLW